LPSKLHQRQHEALANLCFRRVTGEFVILLNIGVLALVAVGGWWLTGIDKTAGGESKRGRHFFRALRCGVLVFLVWVFLRFMEGDLGYGGVTVLLIIPVSIALLLRSSLSEMFTRGLLGMIDPNLHDHRELDTEAARRHRDEISRLIREGKTAEAIQLCETLKQSGELDEATLVVTLEFLGVKQERVKISNPLNDAARLRADGKFADAEKLLRSLLEKNPGDTGAAMMLMRLYALEWPQPGRAAEVLRALEKTPHVDAAHLEFARRSLDEWNCERVNNLQIPKRGAPVRN
jgi:hypothetical protein